MDWYFRAALKNKNCLMINAARVDMEISAKRIINVFNDNFLRNNFFYQSIFFFERVITILKYHIINYDRFVDITKNILIHANFI